MKICFATNNQNKLKEIREALKNKVEILSLSDINCFDELPENQNTLEGNSREKAEYVTKKFKVSCFADDTGLEIEALNGEPGVYSARYAGEPSNSQNNIDKVLNKLSSESNRKAQFRTIITLILDGEEHQFEGTAKGQITTQRSGEDGFGYDPIFIPDGYDITFAEMSVDQKNKISHRGIAVRKLIDYLSK